MIQQSLTDEDYSTLRKMLYYDNLKVECSVMNLVDEEKAKETIDKNNNIINKLHNLQQMGESN